MGACRVGGRSRRSRAVGNPQYETAGIDPLELDRAARR
jgi:hypothetical protein